MKKPLVITASVAVAVATAGLIALSAYLPHPFEDPQGARCNAPKAQFGTVQALPDHRELDVHFSCAGAVLAGTLNLPASAARATTGSSTSWQPTRSGQ